MVRELLFAAPGVEPGPWTDGIRRRWPDLPIRVWPDATDLDVIDAAIAWGMAPGFWTRFPNLKAILSLGAGVDRLLADTTLPPNVDVVRLVDPTMAAAMRRYVTHAVLHHTLRMDVHARNQADGRWRWASEAPTVRARVCVLGLGELGSAVASALGALDLEIHGWSLSPKALPQVQSFAGAGALMRAIEGCQAVVCLLPLTKDTRGILDRSLFAAMASGGAVVNVGRGEHLVEADLLQALDSGQLAGATLDVFEEEPLPPTHPFWSRPDVRITPHVAAGADPASATEALADSLDALLRGQRPRHAVDRGRGY